MKTYEQARQLGLDLAHENSPDFLLVAFADALEDWNIHDLAATLRDRSHDVPQWLRGLSDNPWEPGQYAGYLKDVEHVEKMNADVMADVLGGASNDPA